MDRVAQAPVTPVRQRTQYSCMSASMMMCLNAHGHSLTEDEVNQVLGATPMRGASWEQMLACAQYFGCRATLTTPSTVTQLKQWTDAGVPVVIAWNPEGRPWSHASVVFHVDDARNIHIADPNIPNPEKTVRVISEDDFYSKWFEKYSESLIVRRPACAITREVTPTGKVVQATRRDGMNKAFEYGPIPGMEGPFNYRGRILYYDPRYKGGSYYDRERDIYLEHDEAVRIINRVSSSSARQVEHWIRLYAGHDVVFSDMAIKGLRAISHTVSPEDRTVKGAVEVWAETMLETLGQPPTRRSNPEVFTLADEMGFNMQEIISRIEEMQERGERLRSVFGAAKGSLDLYARWSAEFAASHVRITPWVQRGLETLSYYADKNDISDVKEALLAWVEDKARSSEILQLRHAGLDAVASILGTDVDLEWELALKRLGKQAASKSRKPGVVQAPKPRDPNAEALAGQRNRGDGAHQNRMKDVERGRSRKEKHRTDWQQKEAAAEATLTQTRRGFIANQAFLSRLLERYSGSVVRDQTIVRAGQFTLTFTPDGRGGHLVEGAPPQVLIKAAQFLKADFIQEM